MKLQQKEFWGGTYHGRHDGTQAKVTATRDDTRPEPFAWTCTCGASQSFPHRVRQSSIREKANQHADLCRAIPLT
ncbi:hypothetical protein [Streptomyces diastatochromogenes]|uniref:hypothetical protein n=1 Tax=Streptomyces diastatochromogenes TaxID=42236 RepID=UPI0036C601EB